MERASSMASYSALGRNGMPYLLLSHPLAARPGNHPKYILLGFSAALAPKFHPILHWEHQQAFIAFACYLDFLGNYTRFWEAPVRFGRLWQKLLGGLEGSGKLQTASGKLVKAPDKAC